MFTAWLRRTLFLRVAPLDRTKGKRKEVFRTVFWGDIDSTYQPASSLMNIKKAPYKENAHQTLLTFAKKLLFFLWYPAINA